MCGTCNKTSNGCWKKWTDDPKAEEMKETLRPKNSKRDCRKLDERFVSFGSLINAIRKFTRLTWVKLLLDSEAGNLRFSFWKLQSFPWKLRNALRRDFCLSNYKIYNFQYLMLVNWFHVNINILHSSRFSTKLVWAFYLRFSFLRLLVFLYLFSSPKILLRCLCWNSVSLMPVVSLDAFTLSNQ